MILFLLIVYMYVYIYIYTHMRCRVPIGDALHTSTCQRAHSPGVPPSQPKITIDCCLAIHATHTCKDEPIRETSADNKQP